MSAASIPVSGAPNPDESFSISRNEAFMKTLLLAFTVLILPVQLAADESPPRIWTSEDGVFRLEGSLLKVEPEEGAPERVVIRKKDGKSVTVDIRKLSQDDRDYLEKLQEQWFERLVDAEHNEVVVVYVWGDHMGGKIAEKLLLQFVEFAKATNKEMNANGERKIRFVILNVDDKELAESCQKIVADAGVKIVLGKTPDDSTAKISGITGGSFPAIGIWHGKSETPKFIQHTGQVDFHENPFEETPPEEGFLGRQKLLIENCRSELERVLSKSSKETAVENEEEK
jgi:hypothetical protein